MRNMLAAGALATTLIATTAPAASATKDAVAAAEEYPTTYSQVAVGSDMYPALKDMKDRLSDWESLTPFTAKPSAQVGGYWNKPSTDTTRMRGVSPGSVLQQLKSAGPYTTCDPSSSLECVDGPLHIDALLGVDEATVDSVIPISDGGTCVASETVECNGDGSSKTWLTGERLAIYSCSGSWAGSAQGDDPSDGGSPRLAVDADANGSGYGEPQSPRCDAPPISGGAPTTIPGVVGWLATSGHRIAVADPASGTYGAASKAALVRAGLTWTDSGPGQNVFRGSACDSAGPACKVRLESEISQVRGAVTANSGGNTQLGLVSAWNVRSVSWTSSSMKGTKSRDPNPWTSVDWSAHPGIDIDLFGVALTGGNPGAAALWSDIFYNVWGSDLTIQYALDGGSVANASVQRRTLTAVSVFDPAQNIDSNMPEDLHTPLRTRQTLYDWARGHASPGPSPRWDNPGSATVRGVTWFPRCPTSAPNESCSGQKTWDAANKWWQQIQQGGLNGNSGNGTAPSMSIPIWMEMANPRPNLMLSASWAFRDPNSYKIKSEVEVTFTVDKTTGKIATVSSSLDVRIGNAHLPSFVTSFMKAVETDYGIPKPDIDYLTKDALVYGQDRIARPYTDGDTPGQAYLPHLRAAQVHPDGKCLSVRAVGGGVHGYRPMIAHKYINDNVEAWVSKVKASNATNYTVRALAGDIYSMFFKNDGSSNAYGSMLGNAPPIWQDLAAQFCTDRSVKQFHAAPNTDRDPAWGLVYQSYMPDLYVYVDDYPTDNEGRPSRSRVQAGDWRNFSNLPVGYGHAYGSCNTTVRGSGGNPWGIAPPIPFAGDGPGERPTEVRHCDLPGTVFDTTVTP
ncbi:hypothetical protein ACIPQJ_33830 [Streptomyces sp. NPDC090082]|uniref:hypothetical protein n=1 Tax=unclassified Streptomyces TaxID=2593676 RepID=UPI0037F42993